MMHFTGGEIIPRRVLCPWRARLLASTLPAVARATAACFVRCSWMVGRGLGLLRGASSGWCVRCSPHGCPSVVRGPSHWRRESAGPPFSRLSRPGEHLTHQPLLAPLRRLKPRPIIHEHLTKHAAVARATAGKVLASRCARQGQSTRRGMISPPVKCSTSTTWYLYRAAGSSSSSSCVRGYQPRPSRPSWP